jgi:26S proteasome regulatory subunit (ATPase 3-interacting protein)
MRAEWVKRKAKCADFVEMAADGMEKKPKEVMKVVGIDSDESEGVKVPEKYAL